MLSLLRPASRKPTPLMFLHLALLLPIPPVALAADPATAADHEVPSCLGYPVGESPVTTAAPAGQRQFNKIPATTAAPASQRQFNSGGATQPLTAPQAAPISTSKGQQVMRLPVAPRSASGKIGLAVGGAKDIGNFRENIDHDFLPLPTDVTYEGLFYDYLFDTGLQAPCSDLFCPSYAAAVSPDPFSNQKEYFLAVGFNSGIEQRDFKRKKLNLIVVLDISGSMGSAFNKYYYDRLRNPLRPQVAEKPQQHAGADPSWSKSKLQVATESVVALLDHLQPNDRFSLVLFNHQAHLSQPMRQTARTDMERLKTHILSLQAEGGTNMSEGMRMATTQMGEFIGSDADQFENRIIFLTDAQPNHGDLTPNGILCIVEKNAAKRIYTSFIGVGVDFNSKLIEAIGRGRGANYYSVHSPWDFRQRMDAGFDYMVTPLVFDLRLKLEAPGYEIVKVYGSPQADEATGDLIKISTLFPSEQTDGETRGGLVLVQMRPTADGSPRSGWGPVKKIMQLFADGDIRLTASYEDRRGRKSDISVATEFRSDGTSYANTGIRKGIVLARYASLLRNWLVAERSRLQPQEDGHPIPRPEPGPKPLPLPDPGLYHRHGIPILPILPILSPWERQSAPLRVAAPYAKLFREFAPYLRAEMAELGDDSMKREAQVLRKLLSAPQ